MEMLILFNCMVLIFNALCGRFIMSICAISGRKKLSTIWKYYPVFYHKSEDACRLNKKRKITLRKILVTPDRSVYPQKGEYRLLSVLMF
ncbi:hypothetical protein J2810_003523 [Chryseobacterium rhizosphaerae]|nr:hypothetical protein [Chryseobacterium rhizosphaerae]